jgi:hypothetical protein
MIRTNTVCPKCGSKSTPIKEKIMGQDTHDLICCDCKHIGWWKDFQPKEQQENIVKQD